MDICLKFILIQLIHRAIYGKYIEIFRLVLKTVFDVKSIKHDILSLLKLRI